MAPQKQGIPVPASMCGLATGLILGVVTSLGLLAVAPAGLLPVSLRHHKVPHMVRIAASQDGYVYISPDNSVAIIGQVRRGETLIPASGQQSGDWMEIHFPAGSPATAWVQGQFGKVPNRTPILGANVVSMANGTFESQTEPYHSELERSSGAGTDVVFPAVVTALGLTLITAAVSVLVDGRR